MRSAADDVPAVPGNADAFPTFDSYIKVRAQRPSSPATRRLSTYNGLPNTGAGGIEERLYAKDLSTPPA